MSKSSPSPPPPKEIAQFEVVRRLGAGGMAEVFLAKKRGAEVPGRQVAWIMEVLQKNPSRKPLPKTTGLSQAEQLKLEDECNLACIQYARQNLGL